jgi:hypothetical protein
MEGEITMKRRIGPKSLICGTLMAGAALILALIPSQPSAQQCPEECPSIGSVVSCTPDYLNCQISQQCDTDADGFTDYEECYGITLADNTTHFRGYMEGGECLDPNKKDLFVILIRATPSSNIPDPSEYSVPEKDPLQYVRSLPINVHLITEAQATSNANYTLDRIVSPTSTFQQKAVRVAESLETATDPNIMGISYEGTPVGRDNALVYTAKIINHVNSVYAAAGASIQPGLIYTYIKQTIAHEIGHMVGPLAPVSARDQERYGGFHYKSGTNVIMDQSVYYTSKGKSVTFYVGTTWTSLDIAGIKLK